MLLPLKNLILPLGILLYSLAHCMPPNGETEKKLAESARTAIQILTPTAIALQRYRSEIGKFPKTLGELVPKYLDKLPPEITDSARKGFVPELNFVYAQTFDLRFNKRDAYTELESDTIKRFVDALEEYKKDNFWYPETLEDLYPNYISAKPDELLRQAGIATDSENTALIYRTRQEFGFEAPNTPPGDDGCRYDFETNEWKCFGWVHYKPGE